MNDFFYSANFVIDRDKSMGRNLGDADNQVVDERAGLALKFIQTPEDYYKWFRYVLQGTYGLRRVANPEEDISLVNLLRFGGDSYDKSFCTVPEGEQIDHDPGHIMMDATKIVGMRLMVYNEATTEILGNSPFKLI